MCAEGAQGTIIIGKCAGHPPGSVIVKIRDSERAAKDVRDVPLVMLSRVCQRRCRRYQDRYYCRTDDFDHALRSESHRM